MAQTLDRLYFLKSSDVCYLEKDNLLKLDHLDSYLEYILTDVDFMTIEDDYMFYIKDETMYKRNLKTGQELVIFRDLDIDQITINAYHGELFIGHKGDNPYTVIYDFDGVYIGTVSDYLGNQISNDYLYWYE